MNKYIVLLAISIIIGLVSFQIALAGEDVDVLYAFKHELISGDKSTVAYWNNLGKLFKKAEKIALKCDSIENTAIFLDISSQSSGAGTREMFSESVENLFLNNPKCFFNALLLVNGIKHRNVIRYIALPVFTEDQTKIDSRIDKFRSDPKYKELIKLYDSHKARLPSTHK